MNKQAYLGLSKLEIGKTVMYKLRYDYVKRKYENIYICIYIIYINIYNINIYI